MSDNKHTDGANFADPPLAPPGVLRKRFVRRVSFFGGQFTMIKERPLLSLRHLLRITVVFGGIQFSWALQLALLTPFVQSLGIPHAFASFMWLCGPISGFIMQPLIGVVRGVICFFLRLFVVSVQRSLPK